MNQEVEMSAKGRNGVCRARAIAMEMSMPLTTRRRRRRREEDERRKNKIMMTVLVSTIRNRKRKAAKLINNINKGQPPEEYIHHGIVCRVGKHATRVIERCSWSSTMVVTNSARLEEALDGIIPYDVMSTEILPRLPVKSLASFRCVCKQWRSLAYDPCFAMEQFIRGADADPASTRLCMIDSDSSFPPIIETSWMYDLKGLDCNGNANDGDRKIIDDMSFVFEFRCSASYMLSNSINGLVCASCRDDSGSVVYSYLFNPTTREGLPLPEFNGGLDSCIGTLSLGFDSSSGQYKVVSACVGANFHVLTVGSQEWRCLPKTNCLVFSTISVFLDGALHWQAIDKGTGSTFILAFDIKDERFRFIPIPDTIVSLGRSLAYHLGVWKLKGHLCLVLLPEALRGVHGSRGTCLIMWKLEDGANHEWRRVHDIDMTGCVDVAPDGHIASVIDEVCGKILIKWGPGLYAYDIEGSKTLSLITKCLPEWLCFDVLLPSLVSPSRLPALL